MSQHDRLNAVLTRLASATSVQRTRAYDAARDDRNGAGRDQRLEEVITKLESLADELWNALAAKPDLASVGFDGADSRAKDHTAI